VIVAPTIGPTLGGWITDNYTWRWIFFINLPIGILALFLGVVGLVSLVIWEWFYKNPIVQVRLYKNLNFLQANFMMFILGVMLFASLVMMPLFLQSLLGYSAESAGLVLSGGGVLLLFMMPVMGFLSSKVQARYLIAFGLVGAIGCDDRHRGRGRPRTLATPSKKPKKTYRPVSGAVIGVS
jgi:DHA2 family multidrug resistance protein